MATDGMATRMHRLLLACVLLVSMLGAAVPAYAAEPQFDGEANLLANEDWMSGIAGERYLSDIVLPGTSGSATSNLCLTGQQAAGNWSTSSAKAQDATIATQLTRGVRLFELHLTAEEPGAGWSGSKDTLWVAERITANGSDALCYAQDANDNVISFKRAINYMRSFLKKHPYETVVVALSEADDASKVFKNLRTELDDYKNYLYLGSEMPKLKDVRGKVVVCTTHPELLGQNGGMAFPARGTTASLAVGGVSFSSTTIADAAGARGLTFADSVPRTGDVHATRSSVVYAGAVPSHGNEPTPRDYANVVNPVLFGDSGTFATRGTLYGWVLVSFLSQSQARQLWEANYPPDLEYWTVEFWTDQPQEQRIAQTHLLKGARAYAPACNVEIPGKFIESWRSEDGSQTYGVNEGIPVTSNGTKVWATWNMTWASLASWLLQQSGGANKVVTLDANLTATPLDGPLVVPEYANVTIDLAGHTLNRGLSKRTEGVADGSAIQLAAGATLTLTGGGTITGGYTSGSGGGVLMGEDATLTLGDVSIMENRAVGSGAGVFVPEGATLKVHGTPVVKRNSTKVPDTASVDSNVFLGKDTTIVVDGTLASEACIDVTTYQKPRTGEPVVITDGLEGKGSVANFRSDDSAYKVCRSSGEAALSTGFVVTFNSMGGTAVPDQRVAEGMPAHVPDYTPVKFDTRRVWVDNLNGSFAFKGWYADEACTQEWDFSTPVQRDMTLYAKWCVRYTFDNAGGEAPQSSDSAHPMEYDSIDRLYYIDLEVGETIPAPTAASLNPGMELEGWVYKTWRDDQTGRLYNFTTPATSSVAFTARWRRQTEPPHTVWFSPRNGTSGMPSITVAHGQHIALAQIPTGITRTGYDLEGWYTNDFFTNKWDFATDKVTSDLTLYANWTPQTHVVQFVDTDGTPLADQQSVPYGAQATKPDPNPQKEGYRFSGWHAPDEREGYAYSFTRPVYEDLTLTAMWTPLHTVTLNANGGTVSPTSYVVRDGRWISHEYGISDLPTPTRDGHLFKGWYYYVADETAQGWHFGDRYSVSYPVRADITVIAMWEPVSAPDPGPDPTTKTWKVVFDSKGGTPVDTQAVVDGQCASMPDPAPTGLAGFTFDRWYADGQVNEYDFNTPVTSDLVLRAGWMPITYDVTYERGNGEEPFVEKIGCGSCMNEPSIENPTRDGFVFKHWAKNGEQVPYDFTLPVTQNMTLAAVWAQLHTVTFDAAGGGEVDSQPVEHGQTVVEPQGLVKEGHVLRCWYLTDPDVPYDFATPVEADVTLHAAWDEVPTAFNVVFDAAGGSPVDSQRVHAGETVAPPLDPTRAGHRFAGWYLGNADAPYDFSSPVTQDLVLVAHWIEPQATTHEVTFDLNWQAPSAMQPQTVHDGGVATQPTDPEREGYDFVGWYELLPDGAVSQDDLDAAGDVVWIDRKGGVDQVLLPYDFSSPVIGNVLLRARWRAKKHTVTFNTQGGSELSPVVVSHGDTLAFLRDPIRKGFSFDGWSTDQEGKHRHALATPITGDLLLYAQWKESPRLRVDFDANGGGDVPSQEVAYYGLATEPAALTREGHAFDGWWEVLPEGYITRAQAAELINDDPAVADRLCFDDDRDGKALRRFNFATPVTHDLELRAKWDARLLDVRFVSGGELVDEQVVAWGDRATLPQDPYRYGFVFAGWYADEGLTKPYDVAASTVTQDLTLYAKFAEATYTVAFDSAGGSAVGTQTVRHGDLAIRPADPVREGHAFLGWFVDGADEPFDFSATPILDDLTLRARWDGADVPDVEPQTYQVHTAIANTTGSPVVSSREGSFDAVMRAMFLREATAAKADVYVTLTSSAVREADLGEEERDLLAAKLRELEAQAGVWFDLSIAKRVGSEQADSVGVHTTDQPLKLALAVPQALKASGGTNRTFYVLRVHEGAVDVLAKGTGDSLNVESDRYSTHVLAYADAAQTSRGGQAGQTGQTSQAGQGSATTATSTTGSTSTPSTGDRTEPPLAVLVAGMLLVLVGCRRLVRRTK